MWNSVMMYDMPCNISHMTNDAYRYSDEFVCACVCVCG